MHATTVAVCEHAVRSNREQTRALNSIGRHYSGWLCPSRPSEQGPVPSPHLSSTPTQWLARTKLNKRTESSAAPHLLFLPQEWLAVPTTKKRTEVRTGPSPLVLATTVAG